MSSWKMPEWSFTKASKETKTDDDDESGSTTATVDLAAAMPAKKKAKTHGTMASPEQSPHNSASSLGSLGSLGSPVVNGLDNLCSSVFPTYTGPGDSFLLESEEEQELDENKMPLSLEKQQASSTTKQKDGAAPMEDAAETKQHEPLETAHDSGKENAINQNGASVRAPLANATTTEKNGVRPNQPVEPPKQAAKGMDPPGQYTSYH